MSLVFYDIRRFKFSNRRRYIIFFRLLKKQNIAMLSFFFDIIQRVILYNTQVSYYNT
jgi:hypothetical protein